MCCGILRSLMLNLGASWSNLWHIIALIPHSMRIGWDLSADEIHVGLFFGFSQQRRLKKQRMGRPRGQFVNFQGDSMSKGKSFRHCD
jgi:hypothetical protein